MAYFYTLFIILVIGFVIYRIIKKKSTPSNHYTPYDNITMGNKIDVNHEHPISDTNHVFQYEDKEDNDKTS